MNANVIGKRIGWAFQRVNMSKSVIKAGDTTTHGGKVMTGVDALQYGSVSVAGFGDLVSCPLCKGTFPIVEGSDFLMCEGKKIALEGMLTACGARLIASQGHFGVK